MRSSIARMAAGMMLFVLGCRENAKPVILGTVAVLAQKGDAVWCCATNEGTSDITLLGVIQFDVNGTLVPLAKGNLSDATPPTTLGAKRTMCFLRETPDSQFYRCEFFGEGTQVEQALAGSLMIGVVSGDPNRVHAIVEAHRIPGTTTFVPTLRPCGETFPECNGSCPPNDPFCLRDDTTGSCYCGIR
jgi:hypothetical protein